MPEPLAIGRNLWSHSACSPMDKLFISHGGLSSLCFDRNSFFDSDFNVDKFLSSHTQRGIQLEVLKDDLATYRKILQSALIQLIDREYADFVHLSSSLVGVEKSIDNLRVPVENDLRRIEKCVSDLSRATSQIDEKIRRREQVQAEQRNLGALLSAMGWLETLVGVDRKLVESEPGSARLPLLFRATDLLKNIYMKELNISTTPWYAAVRERLAFADTSVTRIMAEDLILTIQKGDSEAAQNVFCVYEHLGRRGRAFQVLAEDFVKPRLTTIVRDAQARRSSLFDILTLLRDAVETHFYCMIYVDDCDIILESVWSSIVEVLVADAQPFFIPDRAADFHRNFRDSKAFMHQFVTLFSGVRREFGDLFWKHPSTLAFLDKWSVSIYYQVRFMEIGSPLELAVSQELHQIEDPSSGTVYGIHSTQVLWNSVMRCWDAEVCLEELLHRFWKLTLVLVARYLSSLKSAVWTGDSAALISDVLADLTTLASDLKRLPRDYVLPYLTENHQKADAVELLLSESLIDTFSVIKRLEDSLLETLASNCAAEMTELMRQTQDIPRLFRRTNRETPVSASPFVNSAFDMLAESVGKASLTPAQQTEFGRMCIEKVLKQYTSWVLDQLEAVRRMEDSLKKLKKTRFQADPSAGLSDDDKIREQLALDVLHVKERFQGFGWKWSEFGDLVAAEERVVSERPRLESK